MDKKQDIGAAIKEKLSGYAQATANAESIWDNVAAELDNQSSDREPLPFWLKTGSGLLIVVAVVFGVWYFALDTTTYNPETPAEFTDANQLNSEDKNGNPDDNSTAVTPIVNSKDSQKKNAKASLQAGNIESDSTSTVVANSENESTNKTAAGSKVNPTSAETQTVVNQSTVSQSAITKKNSIGLSKQQDATSGVPLNTGSSADTQITGSNPQNKSTTIANKSTLKISSTTKKGPPRGYYVWNKSTLREQGLAQTAEKPIVLLESQEYEYATELPAAPYSSGSKNKKTKAMRLMERELKKEEVLDYKWTIGPIIAPTSYGSLTKGSMLDARLEDNPREGETNLSYGIRIKNQFAKKSALRFGVNRINLGYNTQNFQVNIIDDIVNIYQLTGIDPATEIQNGAVPLSPQATAFFNSNDVVGIQQDISYLEFPLEYEYALINSRFGANLIGGSSLIVLNENSIFAVSEAGERLNVGTSNNLTSLGYTLNLGVGLEYEISKRIQFSVDPIFKMQLNSPENTSVNNFKPYYFGIYSGLSFKF